MRTSVEVKICGLTRRCDVELAAELGAGYVGFVLVPASPRCVTVSGTASHPGAVKVSVTLRSSPPLASTLMWNEVEVRPSRSSGEHHALCAGCVRLHEPAVVVSSTSWLPAAASNSSSPGVTFRSAASGPAVLSSLQAPKANVRSASSR